MRKIFFKSNWTSDASVKFADLSFAKHMWHICYRYFHDILFDEYLPLIHICFVVLPFVYVSLGDFSWKAHVFVQVYFFMLKMTLRQACLKLSAPQQSAAQRNIHMFRAFLSFGKPYPEPAYTRWSSVNCNAIGWPSVHWDATGCQRIPAGVHWHTTGKT